MELGGEENRNIVVAGHIAIDHIIDSPDQVIPRKALGGGASYSALVLKSLGYDGVIVTKIGSDFPLGWIDFLKEKGGTDVSRSLVASEKTTSFRIDRTVDPRKLWLLARCRELASSDFANFTQRSGRGDVLVLNPIAGEISLSLLDRVSKEFEHVFVDSQGFVRRILGKTQEVAMRSGLDISSLSGVDLLKSDREELSAWTGLKDAESSIRLLSKFVEYVMVPSGGGSVELYEKGELLIRATPDKVEAVDTTGAGDILLAVFAARYSETKDIKESLAFSVSSANLSVRRYGIEKAILERKEVESLERKIRLETF